MVIQTFILLTYFFLSCRVFSMRTPTETLKQSTAMARVLQSCYLYKHLTFLAGFRKYQNSSGLITAPPVWTPNWSWRRDFANELLSWTCLHYSGKEMKTAKTPDQPQNGQMLYVIWLFTLHKCIRTLHTFIHDDHQVYIAGSSSIRIHFKPVHFIT